MSKHLKTAGRLLARKTGRLRKVKMKAVPGSNLSSEKHRWKAKPARGGR